MKKYLPFLPVLIFVLFARVYASDLQIENNGSNSQNSIQVDNQKNQTVQQNNSAVINNNINANASTGGNNVSGNNGNSTVVTGDANVTINVNNTANSNNSILTCPTCSSPTPTKNQITPTATNTPKPGEGSGSNNNSNNGSSSNSSSGSSSNSNTAQGGIGGGEILGLASTNGTDIISLASNILGVLCLGFGSALVSHKQRVK